MITVGKDRTKTTKKKKGGQTASEQVIVSDKASVSKLT